ncbi:MAG: PRC-barrel domain-containing protein [Nitrosopumilaceae archaeon]
MSSDLRTKKLRGSGGYIMASVTDDQQRKGNLGGPDLFLAPIGRIETEKISKYHCNTCEKDFEGSPRIDYQTPNEVVADNLILSEKGQYICGSCASVIAEYRNFKKPDEAGEVGFAKQNTIAERVSDNPFAAEITQRPQSTQSQTEFILPEMIPTTPYQAEQPTLEDSFSSVIGMAVYGPDARKIGTVKSVGAQSGQLVVVVTKNDGNDTTIKWEEIKKVGEIILLGEMSAQTVSSKCANCSFENKPDSKFCESCGGKL